MTHNERFLKAMDLVRKEDYKAALNLYLEPEALQSDARVIERRIATHQQHRANANRSD